MTSCNLEINTLKVEKDVLEGVESDETVEKLYHRVQQRDNSERQMEAHDRSKVVGKNAQME